MFIQNNLELQEVLSLHGFVVHGFAVHGFLLGFNSLFLTVQTQSSRIFRMIITKIAAEIFSLFAHSFLSNHFAALGSDSMGVIMEWLSVIIFFYSLEGRLVKKCYQMLTILTIFKRKMAKNWTLKKVFPHFWVLVLKRNSLFTDSLFTFFCFPQNPRRVRTSCIWHLWGVESSKDKSGS